MIAFPNAKINIGLHIINKREDGFHNLETTFLSVKLYDMLEVIEQKSMASGESKINFKSVGISIEGAPEDNLVVKAYDLLAADFSLPPIDVCLFKNIPMGAGLGGGSSDAAFMLKLLNEKFRLNLSDDELTHYAAKLGSDCAFFIKNQPSYVFGKGHELEPLQINLHGWFLVLVCPPVHSSTALAYQNASKRNTLDEATSIKKLIQLPVEKWKGKIENDFEQSVFKQYHQLSDIKTALYDAGAAYASMSGSGSALYGLYKEQPVIGDALKKIMVYQGRL